MYHINTLLPRVKKIAYSGLTYVIILLAGQNSVSAQDCEKCSIDVSFTGIYSDETCEIVINDKGSSDTVELPVISVQSLKKPGSEAGSKSFIIALKNCPADRSIQLKFVSNISQADKTTGNLLNTSGAGYSKNTQIRLRKEDGIQISIDDLASSQNYFIPESGEIVTHDYIASYYSTGDSGAGLVKTTAGIELFYK